MLRVLIVIFIIVWLAGCASVEHLEYSDKVDEVAKEELWKRFKK